MKSIKNQNIQKKGQGKNSGDMEMPLIFAADHSC